MRAAIVLASLAGLLAGAPATADLAVSCHIRTAALSTGVYAVHPTNAPPDGLRFNNGNLNGSFVGMPESSGDYVELRPEHLVGGEFRSGEADRRAVFEMRLAVPVREGRLEVTMSYRGRALGQDEDHRGTYVATFTEPRAGGPPRVRTSRGRATCSFGV